MPEQLTDISQYEADLDRQIAIEKAFLMSSHESDLDRQIAAEKALFKTNEWRKEAHGFIVSAHNEDKQAEEQAFQARVDEAKKRGIALGAPQPFPEMPATRWQDWDDATVFSNLAKQYVHGSPGRAGNAMRLIGSMAPDAAGDLGKARFQRLAFDVLQKKAERAFYYGEKFDAKAELEKDYGPWLSGASPINQKVLEIADDDLKLHSGLSDKAKAFYTKQLRDKNESEDTIEKQLTRIRLNAGYAANSTITGLLQLGSEWKNFVPFGYAMGDLVEKRKREREESLRQYGHLLETPEYLQGSLSEKVTNPRYWVETVGNMVPDLAIAVAAPEALPARFAIQALGQYGEYREQGASPGSALVQAGLASAVNAAAGHVFGKVSGPLAPPVREMEASLLRKFGGRVNHAGMTMISVGAFEDLKSAIAKGESVDIEKLIENSAERYLHGGMFAAPALARSAPGVAREVAGIAERAVDRVLPPKLELKQSIKDWMNADPKRALEYAMIENPHRADARKYGIDKLLDMNSEHERRLASALIIRELNKPEPEPFKAPPMAREREESPLAAQARTAKEQREAKPKPSVAPDPGLRLERVLDNIRSGRDFILPPEVDLSTLKPGQGLSLVASAKKVRDALREPLARMEESGEAPTPRMRKLSELYEHVENILRQSQEPSKVELPKEEAFPATGRTLASKLPKEWGAKQRDEFIARQEQAEEFLRGLEQPDTIPEAPEGLLFEETGPKPTGGEKAPPRPSGAPEKAIQPAGKPLIDTSKKKPAEIAVQPGATEGLPPSRPAPAGLVKPKPSPAPEPKLPTPEPSARAGEVYKFKTGEYTRGELEAMKPADIRHIASEEGVELKGVGPDLSAKFRVDKLLKAVEAKRAAEDVFKDSPNDEATVRAIMKSTGLDTEGMSAKEVYDRAAEKMPALVKKPAEEPKAERQYPAKEAKGGFPAMPAAETKVVEARKAQMQEPKPAEAPKPAEKPAPVEPPKPEPVKAEEAKPAEPEQAPETRTSELADKQKYPVRQMNPQDIEVDPETFQFKQGTDAKTGVAKPLKGPWNELDAGNMLVWERKDGKRFIVNGHHRLELAKRLGVKAVNVQIVREADGVTPAKAKEMGAFSNIRDGKGEFDDYVEFFRNTSLSDEAIEKGGLLENRAGREAFQVGRNAGDDLYSAYKNGAIKDSQAAIIAEYGKGDDALQRVGINAAAKERWSMEELAEFMRIAKDERKASPKMESGDLFGIDDSAVNEWAKTMKAAVKIIAKKRADLLAVQGALRRPENAKKMGLEGKFEEIQERVDAIKKDLAKWEDSHWRTDRKLNNEVRRAAGLPEIEEGGAPPKGTTFQAGGEGYRPTTMERGGEAPSPGSIIAKLSRDFGVPIRKGFVTGKPKGIYKVFEQVARLKGKFSDDLGTAVHEVAHHIDNVTKLIENLPQSMKDELGMLDYKAPKRQLPEEGLAQYVRFLLTGERNTAQAAPSFDKFFNGDWAKSNKELYRKLMENRDYIAKSEQAGAMGRIHAQMSETGIAGRPADQTVIRTATDAARNALSWTYRKFVESYQPLAGMSKMARKAGYEGMTAYEMANAFRMSTGSLAEDAAMNGIFHISKDKFGNRIGPSLRDVYQGLEPSEYGDAMAFAYARHAIDSWGRNQNPGISLNDARYVYEMHKDNPRFVRAADTLTKAFNALLDLKQEAGLLTPEAVERMKAAHPNYLNLERVTPGVIERMGGSRFINLPKGVHARFGSGEAVLRPDLALAREIERTYSLVSRQEVANRIVDMARKTPGMGWAAEILEPTRKPISITFEQIKSQLKDMGIDVSGVSEADAQQLLYAWKPQEFYKGNKPIGMVRVDGKPKWVEFDRDIFDAVSGLNRNEVPYFIDLVFGSAMRLNKLGATGISTTFPVPNIIRDFGTNLFQTKYQGPLERFVAPMDMLRAYIWSKVAGKNDPYVQLFERFGGDMGRLMSVDINKLKNLRELAMAKTPWDKAKLIIKRPLRTTREVIGVSDVGPRLAELRAYYRNKGYSKERLQQMLERGETPPQEITLGGTNAARDVTVNFSRHGDLAGWLNIISGGFYNATVQGSDKLMRTVVDNPKAAFINASAMAAVGLAYWLSRKDDDDFKDKQPWLKYGFFDFPLAKGGSVRLKMSEPMMIVVGGTMALAEKMYGRDPEAINKWAKNTGARLTPDIAPPILTTVLEEGMNKDLFRGTSIVPKNVENLAPELQSSPYTTETSKAIGGTLGVSPARVEHVLEKTTGGLYPGRIRTIEKLARGERADATDIPFLGSLGLRKDYAESIGEFYDERERINREAATAKYRKEFAKESRLKRRAKFLEDAAERISDLRKKQQQAKTTQEKSEIENRIIGIARSALGKESLERYRK